MQISSAASLVSEALKENPSLVLRVLKNALSECLANEEFKTELVDTLKNTFDIQSVEPLYDRALAIRLVPCTKAQFNRLAKKLILKPPYYRLVGAEHRRHRLFYASDIEKIREALNAPFRENTKLRFSSAGNRAASTGKLKQAAFSTF